MADATPPFCRMLIADASKGELEPDACDIARIDLTGGSVGEVGINDEINHGRALGATPRGAGRIAGVFTWGYP